MVELWHGHEKPTRPCSSLRRRFALILGITLGAALVVVVAVLLRPAQAELHPARGADDLTARFRGRYTEEIEPRPEHGASSTSTVRVYGASSAWSVFVSTSTYPNAARAAFAYRYWSPTRSSWIKPWYEPVSKPYPSDVVRVARGTEARGLHCVADGYPECDTWVFWQIEGSTLRETRITGKPFSYDEATAEFAWVGSY